LKRRGRKPKVYPVEVIEGIIIKYKEVNPNSKILKYLEMHRFSEELFINGKISIKFSEDFWRKPGRQGKDIIDKTNQLYLSTVVSKKENAEQIISTEEVLNKIDFSSHKNKKEIITMLKINEYQAKKYIELIKKYDYLQSENEQLREKLEESAKRNGIYQKIIFSWMSASYASSNQIINMIDTGKKKGPIVEHSFNNMFSNPIEGYEMFETYAIELLSKSNKNEKLVAFNKTRIEKLFTDFDS
jgi:hypothetical protein